MRLPVATVVPALLLASLCGVGCGAGAGVASRSHAPLRPARPASGVARPAATIEPDRLPAPVSGEAVLAGAGGITVLGGLDSLDVSTREVFSIPADLHPRRVATLAEAKHDLAAARIAGRSLVFGGGSATELDAVEALGEQGSGERVGTLPSPRSDLAAATVGHTAYLLGGYDGTEPLGDVLGTTDGSHFSVVARLPVPVRYAAVVAMGEDVYAFGGELADGRDSNAIQRLATATGLISVIAHLPRPVSHASAVVLGGKAYILGGRAHGVALRRILAFDPATKATEPAGRLPIAVTNAAAATLGGVGYLIGGLGSVEQTLDTVIAIRLTSTP